MLPTFIVIGAAKCGTTSLCELLGEHHEVFVTDPKEPHYFSTQPEVPSRRVAYENLFRGAKCKLAMGEGSVSYTLPKLIYRAAKNIHRYVPECRLIYMVRNPISRIESDWRMRMHERRVPCSINEAVTKQENLIKIGKYWKNLNVYRDLFPDEQILIVFLEDFSKDPYHEIERCFKHIGVSSSFRPRNAHKPRNAANGFRQYSSIASYILKFDGFRKLQYHMPGIVENFFKILLTKKEYYPVKWDPKFLEKVKIEFLDDSIKLLSYCSKPRDFWQF